MVDIKPLLDMHKKVIKPATVGLAQNGPTLRVTSTSASGNTSLWSFVATEPAKLSAVVDFAALYALLRSSKDATLSVQDGSLHVVCGKTSGDLPIQNENQSRPPKLEGVKLDDAGAQWMCDNIPRVRLSDLDKTGLLSIECDGKEWRLSCVDDVHGACVFGEGKSKIKFSLTPADAEALGAVIAGSEATVSLGFVDSTLVVKSDPHIIAIPSVDGSAQTRETIDSGNIEVGKLKAEDLREALSTLAPVASAKDAAPVTIKLKPKSISLSVTSPAGSVQSEIAARCSQEAEFRVSHSLFSALADKASDITTLLVRKEGKDITRITLRCTGELALVMLTSS